MGRKGSMRPGDMGFSGFETPTPHCPADICGAIACVQGHLHYRGGLLTSGHAMIRPRSLQISSMSRSFACMLRGRLRFCAVFLTPPAPPNALQRTLLA